jgi:hypothetical protein
MVYIDPKTQSILNKYGSKLGGSVSSVMDQPSTGNFSKDYEEFRSEATKLQNSLYERACKSIGSLIDLAPAKKEEKEALAQSIEEIHLDITPSQAYTFAIMIMFGFILLGFATFMITMLFGFTQILVPFLLVMAGVVLFLPLTKWPQHLAQKRRLLASNQMVLCVLYIVIYMRHTSNLEHAIKFAGEHVGHPLNLDLRKVLWDTETKRFATIQESLEYFLQGWKDHNLAFVESIHLIEASLVEGKEERRIELLEKSLEVILEGTYDSMLHYAQEVKGPMTMLHMLGVILPILGLIILPLIGSFMGIKWFHIAMVYNFFLPFIVFYFGYSMLAKRPIGYAQTDVSSLPQFAKLKKIVLKTGKNSELLIDPKHVMWFLIFVFMVLGWSPIILHALDPTMEVSLSESVLLLDYRITDTGQTIGPFGLGATLISLLIPGGLAMGLGAYYLGKSKKLIKIREQTLKLETEFRGAIFQLGNRIGGGMPSEKAFGVVANSLKGSPTGDFLSIVDKNIRSLGMSLHDAIFNSKNGAILQYPSSLIESTMKVLVESALKGPLVVSRALLSIADYLDRIYKVGERLKDLLAEITSSMKSQVGFLTPLIAGIVVGIGSMITAIISNLGGALSGAADGGDTGILAGASGIANIFPIEKIIPPFYLQMIVGIYVVQMIYVLSVLANGIENGVDKLNEDYTVGKNLYRGTMLYLLIAGITIFAFNMLALAVGDI